MCAPRAKRVVVPAALRPAALQLLAPRAGDTGGFAKAHDRAVARCLERLLGGQGEQLVLPELALRRAQLPLRFGGLGLRSAAASRVAAHWASWADSMLVVGARHPRILARLLPGLADPHGALGPPCTRAAALFSPPCQRAKSLPCRTT